jgi:hypothetical protein
VITSSGAVGPIARLTHDGVALRRAEQEVDAIRPTRSARTGGAGPLGKP